MVDGRLLIGADGAGIACLVPRFDNQTVAPRRVDLRRVGLLVAVHGRRLDGELADVGVETVSALGLHPLPDLGNGVLFSIGGDFLVPEQEDGEKNHCREKSEGEKRIPARQWPRSRLRYI